MTAPLLSIDDLQIRYSLDDQTIHALRGVTLDIYAGQSTAVVGESGSGKSQLFQAVMGLLSSSAEVSGSIHFANQSLLEGESPVKSLRGKEMSLIMQNAMTALNPYLKIGVQLIEVLQYHQGMSYQESHQSAINMLEKVQLKQAAQCLQRYPHELSGGMQQRVLIAMALLCHPKLLIADEPTTALDVSTQQEIVNLLAQIHQYEKNALVFITHDLSLVSKLCQRIVVMYAGRVIEVGDVSTLMTKAQHPYTQALLQAAFIQKQDRDKPLVHIKGVPMNPMEEDQGCAFAPRCHQVMAQCNQEIPMMDDSGVACFIAKGER
ncbi:MAG: ABC transporter ATP-binding protein [Thiotrichaceae bacterium]|nr:ABC transporter ATP-binding protein [Thiotrichaceae bacterium]